MRAALAASVHTGGLGQRTRGGLHAAATSSSTQPSSRGAAVRQGLISGQKTPSLDQQHQCSASQGGSNGASVRFKVQTSENAAVSSDKQGMAAFVWTLQLREDHCWVVTDVSAGVVIVPRDCMVSCIFLSKVCGSTFWDFARMQYIISEHTTSITPVASQCSLLCGKSSPG